MTFDPSHTHTYTLQKGPQASSKLNKSAEQAVRGGTRCGELLWCVCCRTGALTRPSLPAVRPHRERCGRVGTCCWGANVLVGHWRFQAARGCSQLCQLQAPVPGRSSTALSPLALSPVHRSSWVSAPWLLPPAPSAWFGCWALGLWVHFASFHRYENASES